MKNNLILISVLVVLVIVTIITLKGNKTSNTESQYLIPELMQSINDVDFIGLKRDSETVTLKNQSGTWIVEEGNGFMADANKVAKLLLELRKVTLKEKKTSNPQKYSVLQLADSGSKAGTQVVIKSKNQNISDIYVGKRSQSSTGVYVRKTGDSQSWLAEGALELKLDSSYWLLTTIFDIENNQIKSVTYSKSETETLIINKLTPDDQQYHISNLPAGKQIKSSVNLSDLANGLKSFTIDTAIPRQEFEPDLTVSYEDYNGTKYNLNISQVDEKYILNISYENSDSLSEFDLSLQNWSFEIPSYKYNALNQTLDSITEDIPLQDIVKESGVVSDSE